MRLAILGYGHWGTKLAAAAVKAGHTIAVVADPAWHRLAEARVAHPDAAILHYADSAIEHYAAEAVVIATPSDTHCRLALASLRNGRHTLVTKPMATSTADAEAMVDAARMHGRVLMVDHTWLYDERVEALAAKQPTVVDSIRTNTDGRGGDALWDLLPHDLAILDAFGFDLDPATFNAFGADGAWSVHYADAHGRRARIHVANGAEARVRSLVTSAGIVPDTPPPSEPLVREFQHFADVCAGRATCRTPGEQGLRVVRVIESLAAQAAGTEAAE